MPPSQSPRMGRGFDGPSQDDTSADHPEPINEASVEPSHLQVSQVRFGSEKLRPLSAVAFARTGTEGVVRLIINARAERREFLPSHLFADPAWDMLLDLYLADILSQLISVTSLCSASNVPASTALRWITMLQGEGLVEPVPDPYDNKRFFMSLSAKGLAAMDGFFSSDVVRSIR